MAAKPPRSPIDTKKEVAFLMRLSQSITPDVQPGPDGLSLVHRLLQDTDRREPPNGKRRTYRFIKD